MNILEGRRRCVSAEIVVSAELRRLRRVRRASRQLAPRRRTKTLECGLSLRSVVGNNYFLMFTRTTLKDMLVGGPIRIDERMGGFGRTPGLRTKRFLSGFIAFYARFRRGRRDFERIKR